MKNQLSFDQTGNPITVNTAWMSESTGTELDGTTGYPNYLQTTATVEKGQDYSIEFALADASDHIYDSTAYLSNFVGAGDPVDIYGLFVGVTDDTADGIKDATELHQKMSNNLSNWEQGHLLVGDLGEGGVTNAEIEKAVNYFKDKMQPGDKFIFYASGHGAGKDYDVATGDETTVNKGDEIVELSKGEPFWDDTLKLLLEGMPEIEKWVMIDSCGSGGFWGNYNPYDVGDLEKLSNIGLFASAAEGEDSYSYKITGEGIFTNALEKAFSYDGSYLYADLDEKSGVTFDELHVYLQEDYWWLDLMQQPPFTVWKKGQDDPILFTSDMWSPVSFASDDFVGSLLSYSSYSPDPNPSTEVIPAPGALLLGSIGLGFVGWLRRRRTL